jgi:hypothetical protein
MHHTIQGDVKVITLWKHSVERWRYHDASQATGMTSQWLALKDILTSIEQLYHGTGAKNAASPVHRKGHSTHNSGKSTSNNLYKAPAIKWLAGQMLLWFTVWYQPRLNRNLLHKPTVFNHLKRSNVIYIHTKRYLNRMLIKWTTIVSNYCSTKYVSNTHSFWYKT